MLSLLKSKPKTRHFIGGLALLASLIWLSVFSIPSPKLQLIFCDVGQGDAILIQKGFKQILVDGGPNNKVLDCLSKNMPFWDRTIEIVSLTHPQADHLTGLIPVIERYKVDYFLSGPEGNESVGYKELVAKITKKQTSFTNNPLILEGEKGGKGARGTKGIKVVNPYLGQKIKIAGMELETLWPEKEWVAKAINNQQLAINNFDFAGAVLGVSTTHNLNDFSLVFLLKYDNFRVLLAGDADAEVQDEILLNNSSLRQIDILKVPHHGAKTSLKDDFLETIKPKIAVISVGKNSYGHPSDEVIEKLRNLGIKVRRTDLEGEIKYTF